jgi:hypothetical protein
MTPGCDEFAQTIRDLVSATSLEIPMPVLREHLARCPSCRRRFRFLATAIQAAGADLQMQAVEDVGELLTCEECEDLLPDYLAIYQEQGGEAVEAQTWKPLIHHLHTCPRCALLFSEWLVLEMQPPRQDLPPVLPKPDLSFLRTGNKRTTQAKIFRLNINTDGVGRVFIQFSEELLAATRPVAAVGLRGHRRVLCELKLTEVFEDLSVTVLAEEKRSDPTLCVLTVNVEIAGRGGWPNLGGTVVVATRDGVQLATALTDAYGKAILDAIPTRDLAHLQLEIQPVK